MSETAAGQNRPSDPEDCPECGFEASAISEANAEEVIRRLGPRYHTAISSSKPDEERLRRRPNPDTWSALEYTAHMRDVIAMWGWGLHRTLTEEGLELPAPDPELPDRTAVEGNYNSQDPTVVEAELSANAERMANKVATITTEQWQHTAYFGDTEIGPLWIVRKVAHEGQHHLLDIERSLRSPGLHE